VIARAEEAGGPDGAITRREAYENGILTRVEDDTTGDGQPDKWETYEDGRLTHVDLDLQGRGTPTRRLIYGADGAVDRVEGDPDGDGVFAAVDPPGGQP
jgi:hypothetical protein